MARSQDTCLGAATGIPPCATTHLSCAESGSRWRVSRPLFSLRRSYGPMSEAWVYLLSCSDGSLRVGPSISTADLRVIEPAPRVATRPAGCPSSLRMRCRCRTARPRAARRHASNGYRGLTSSRCSAPLRRQERPVLGQPGQTHARRRRVPAPIASPGSHMASGYTRYGWRHPSAGRGHGAPSDPRSNSRYCMSPWASSATGCHSRHVARRPA
jgi:hypothetical protein